MINPKIEKGSVLLEIAVLFPLFLFGIFFFLWLGTVFNAKSALTNAVARSVRLAITRSDPQLVGGHMIIDLEDFIDRRTESDRFKSLLSREVDWPTADHNYAEFNKDHPLRPRSLSDLPPEYLYSLVYLHEYLRQSLSGQIRYPCDPALPTSDSPPAGAGCIKCIFAGDGSSEFGLDCQYQPSHFLLTPIVNLLRYIVGDALMPQVIIKRKLIFNATGN